MKVIKEEHFKYIMNNYNLKNNELVFFGDSYSDYIVAKNINCKFFGILTKRDDLKNICCDKIINYKSVLNLF